MLLTFSDLMLKEFSFIYDVKKKEFSKAAEHSFEYWYLQLHIDESCLSGHSESSSEPHNFEAQTYGKHHTIYIGKVLILLANISFNMLLTNDNQK